MKKENLVICIFGVRGKGKSYLANQIVQEYDRVIVFDTQNEYTNTEEVRGYDNCIKRLVDASKQKKFRLSIQADNEDEDLRLIELAATIPNTLLVIEEASKYVSAYRLPNEIAKLIRFGRHDCISQIYLARRASELHRDITANSDIIISFHQHEPRDILYLRDFMGKRANKVRKLPKYKFIAWGSKEKSPLIVLQRVNRD